MPRIVPCIALLLCLYSCGQRSSQTESATKTDSTKNVSTTETARPDTMCFRQVIGRDSTLLQLVIKDSTVTGELNVLPFEKDRARGPIQGTLTNNQILANWQRSGEGVTQSYAVVFTLKGDAVTWREGERIEKNGKWVLKNPEQGYEYVLMKADCP
ncbi:hypothetical protein GO755_25140 [Spirosoma sp. HMF4905]|uniref:Uncharacterized protein n=2 Tax=Spirosoma arboris TaxID=2682092 RepID=A0A7K1SHR0_9BACT|nr:hypothetical protein [Spirosoma arboris]